MSINITDVIVNEVIKLRERVYGFDNALSDELAEYLGYEEEPQRETEAKDAYDARVARVAARKARLGTDKKPVPVNEAERS